MSPTVLNDRLRELRDADLVSHDDSQGYSLTPLGQELHERFMPLASWAERWAKSTGGA